MSCEPQWYWCVPNVTEGSSASCLELWHPLDTGNVAVSSSASNLTVSLSYLWMLLESMEDLSIKHNKQLMVGVWFDGTWTNALDVYVEYLCVTSLIAFYTQPTTDTIRGLLNFSLLLYVGACMAHRILCSLLVFTMLGNTCTHHTGKPTHGLHTLIGRQNLPIVEHK